MSGFIAGACCALLGQIVALVVFGILVNKGKIK